MAGATALVDGELETSGTAPERATAPPPGAPRAPRQMPARRASFDYFHDWLAARDLRGVETLDYGCGPGHLAAFLAGRGARVTGIDLSPARIRTARSEAARHRSAEPPRFAVGDCESLPLPDARFGLVCSVGTLSFLDLERAFSELSRVTAAGGTVVLLDTLGHNPIAAIGRRFGQRRGARLFQMGDFAVARRHFGRVEVHYFDFFTVPLIALEARLPGAHALLARLAAVARALDRVALRMPFLRRYAFRFVCFMTMPRS